MEDIYTQKLFDELNFQLVLENLYISLGQLHNPQAAWEACFGGDPYSLISQPEGLVLHKSPQREYSRIRRWGLLRAGNL